MSIRISAANAITNLAETMNLKRLVSNSMQSPPVFSFGGHRCQSVGRFLIIADSGRLETGGLFLCPFPDGKPPKDSGSQVEAAALDFYSCRMAAYFYIGRGGIVVHCNNRKCEYNIDGERCSRSTIYYIDRLCMTFRRMPGAAELMRQPFKARCHKTGGKYRSDGGRVVK